MSFKKNIMILFLVLIFLNFNFVFALESAYGPKIEEENYIISRSKVERILNQGDIFRDFIEITNLGTGDLEVSFFVSEDLSDLVEFESLGIIVTPNNKSKMSFLIKGKGVGNFSGDIIMGKDIVSRIPLNLTIYEDSVNSPVLINVELSQKSFVLKKPLDFKLNLNKLKPGTIPNATLSYSLTDSFNNTYFLGSETRDLVSSFQAIKKFDLPEELEEGVYLLEVVLEYENRVISNKSNFLLRRSFLNILVFGFIPMWILLLVIGLLVGGILALYFIKRGLAKRKKYQMKLDAKTIPKKNPDFLFLGKVAETKILSYLDPGRLTTHCIVAGATGGGKSISAQVIIEEALAHNIAVLVMDPTAQWSGMLRKCTDKKMLSYYPKFGLKEVDSKAFKGNVRQIKNARELIDITKFMVPGQIQIFSLNKLDPKDIDTFVANVIRQIFKSDPKEFPTLKTLLVFDEVHRLLSKFGGSGEGFLQVERACREFRKWGLGVMLVSQVLSDFVGEIKANISTELQMRTRDEGDLKRIETKYGDEFLKSLVKASVGVGMFVNPAYNHAKPYFINFRPILHNTRRLPDEELEKYNKYNDIVDDLEYQIEQLEKEKVDTFDLKMESKLVKDKIMTGSFSVVEIYLEGLVPRVDKEWDKLGKKPKKREIELVAESEIKKSVEEARKARAEFEKKEAKSKKLEKKKPVKEDINIKEVVPLTFDNGVMVSSLKELESVLLTMDNEIFKTHVNEKRNDIADWIGSNLSKADGERLKGVIEKSVMIRELENVGKKVVVKKEVKPTVKPVVKKEVKPTVKPVVKKEVKPIIKKEVKPAAKPIVKKEVKKANK